MTTTRFAGTERYIATEDLMVAVNAAVTLARPLLIKGEPGTGKTQLAEEIALALGRPLYQWHIKSTTRAQQGLEGLDGAMRELRRPGLRLASPRPSTVPSGP